MTTANCDLIMSDMQSGGKRRRQADPAEARAGKRSHCDAPCLKFDEAEKMDVAFVAVSAIAHLMSCHTRADSAIEHFTCCSSG